MNGLQDRFMIIYKGMLKCSRFEQKGNGLFINNLWIYWITFLTVVQERSEWIQLVFHSYLNILDI